ncbi:MAG: hypothetical protein K1X89_25810 [Myxococcaceae bacterium]|nr:hypothetical protein [Myxococcaceae bacterium]
MTSTSRCLALFAAVALSGAALADAPRAAYFDHGKKLTITLEPGLVAEFGKADAKSAVLASAPGAEELKVGAGGPRVFKVPAASVRVKATTSVVYRQGTSPAGRLMALPGGIVVTFKPEWTDAQVREWSAAKGYPVRQKLAITGNWYVLGTPAGQASLDAANAVHQSGEVVSASPNWWLETVTK